MSKVVDMGKKFLAQVQLNRTLLQHMLGKTFDGNRDMYKVLGYERNPTLELFYAKYLRQDIAKRVVDAFPDAIWKKSPKVQEDGDMQTDSPFEMAFNKFAIRNKLFYHMNTLDKMCRLAEYSVLFISTGATEKELRTPLTKLKGPESIFGFQAYHQRNALIHQYEDDVTNPRYGLPLMYSLQTGGYSPGWGNLGGSQTGSSTMPTKTLYVHHSRLIHVAEGTLENEMFGIPILQSILNRLDDLEKVVGGSAEIYWLNSRAGLNLNAPADTQVIDGEKIFKTAEDYANQLIRILPTQGMDVKTLELGIHSPDKHAAVIIELISGATGIPQRILVGSERGELASSQDENNWLARVEERRDNHCEPTMLRPFIKRMMELGVLPTVEDYDIIWPDLISFSEKDKMESGVKRAAMLASYMSNQGSDLIVPPKQFVEEVLCMNYREQDVHDQLDDEIHEELKDKEEVDKQDADDKAGPNKNPNPKT